MPKSTLPIEEIRQQLVAALRTHRRFVLEAPTGSGKSTQVPQMLLDEGLLGDGQVVILQPRRLPARMLARRVAHERGVRLGGEVGYQVRFDRVAGPGTRIKYVTEGLLLRQMLDEGDLRGVSAVIFDEFHERHLHGDVSLAMALRLQATRRPDLVIGVMSATLDAAAWASRLEPCARLVSSGRMHPVAVKYSKDAGAVAGKPVWEQAAWHCARLVADGIPGDCLIFMPGAYEISRTLAALGSHAATRDLDLLPLHGDLPPERQDAVMEPSARRKVIVSTNVAETSLTIEGVRIVIDSGLARIPVFDPRRAIDTLLVHKISRASADQRAGRAGRTAPGTCLRLWGEAEHASRAEAELPEVRRVDLAETLLVLAAGGIRVDDIPWLDAPAPASIDRARRMLEDLGALDADGAVTADGRTLARFPMHPRFARLLLAASERGCVPLAALVVAVAQGQEVLLPISDSRLEEKRDALLGDAGEAGSDFIPELRALRLAREKGFDRDFCRQWGIHATGSMQAWRVADQILRIARDSGLDVGESGPSPETELRKCLALAFADQLAMRLDKATLRCQLVHGRRGDLRRQSTVRRARFLVPAELEERNQGQAGDVSLLLGLCTAVEEEWLAELFPKALASRSSIRLDPDLKRVVSEREHYFQDILIDRRLEKDPDPEVAARFLVDELVAGRIELRNWDEKVERWIRRVNFLARVCPDYGYHAIGPEELHLVYEQLVFGCVSFKEVRELDPWPVLRSFHGAMQNAEMDRLAPEHYNLPSGWRGRLRYEENGDVILSATVQKLYDAPKELRIADGRYLLAVEVLAPNQRPVQLTRDFANFWETSYPQIRKDLKGRYPRHEWR